MASQLLLSTLTFLREQSVLAAIAAASLVAQPLNPFAPPPPSPPWPTPIFHFPGANPIAENLAIRPNGNVLATLFLPEPQLYEIDPSLADVHASGARVAQWTAETHLFGITEVRPDVFQIIAGNTTRGILGVSGSVSVYEVDCRMRASCRGAPVTRVARVPKTGGLDGFATVRPGLTVAGDTAAGSLYLINETAQTAVDVFASPAFEPLSYRAEDGLLTVGINGIQIHHDHLYFTNTAKQTFGRIKLDLTTGHPVGAVELLQDYTAHPAIRPDDFALDATGHVFFGAEPETPGIRYRPSGHAHNTSTVLFANASVVTAAKFGIRPGRDSCTLYVLYGGPDDATASKLGMLHVRDSPLYQGVC